MWKKLVIRGGFHFNGKGGNSWKRVAAPFFYGRIGKIWQNARAFWHLMVEKIF